MDMETNIIQNKDKTLGWAKYYENQKRLWYDPSVPIVVKAIVRLVELHRSDSKGWSISVRRVAELLGISTNTVLKAIDKALDSGYLEADKRIQRKRRKLRLSVSLRAPVEFEITSDNLSHWKRQPVSPGDTESVSRVATVNSNRISKANINIQKESQLKEEIEETPPDKESPLSDSLDKIRDRYPFLRKRHKEAGL